MDEKKKKTSIDDVAHEAKHAIDDIAVKAAHATDKLADATHEAVTTARENIAAGGRAAARKIKGAAYKIETAARQLGKKA